MKKWLVALCGCAAFTAPLAEEEKRWSGDTELGFKSTKGNTNEKSMAFRQSVIYENDPWKNTLKLSADNTDSSGKRTEERYYLTEKLDRSFTKATYGFVRLSYEKDLFSGFDYQSTYVVGFGHKFLDDDKWLFSVETGIGGIYEKLEDAEDAENGLMYYFADEFSWKFSESAELGQSASVEYSDLNTITRASVFVKSRLISSISMRLSYGLKHNSEVEEGKKHTDTEVLATIVYGF